MTLVEITGGNLLYALRPGGIPTNNYPRGMHNLALNLDWLTCLP